MLRSLVSLWLACGLITSCGKKTIASNTVTGPQLKWTYKSPNSALSHPAVASDGTIFVGTNRGALAVSPEGKLLWSAAIDSGGVPILAADGNIYLDTWHGLIYGLSRDGKTIWQPGYGLSAFDAPPALGSGDTLYYMNSVADLFAFRPSEGNTALWSLSTFREGQLTPYVLPGSAQLGRHSKAAPAIARDGTIILPRQNFLHGISPSGSVAWTVELTSGGAGMVALAGDGTIYAQGEAGTLFALDSSGQTKWRFDGSGVMDSPIIDAQGIIYFTDGAAVYALNPDGTLKWRVSQPRLRFFTSPVLAADGTLYLGGEFALIAINPDGSFKWNLRVYTPTSAPTIARDGTILFACGYSWLCAVTDSGSPLMQSAWPKQFHDLANTSNSLTALD